MKITVLNVNDRDLDALLEKVHERAKALGIEREEAYRDAFRRWLERFGTNLPRPEPETATLEATPAELAALEAVLAAMRSYDRR
jgi:hypothetical protein